MHEKLKLILSKETSKIELTNEQSNHVYKTKGEYVGDYQGDLFLKFNNETAWYWNKDIDIEIKFNSNRKIDIINNDGDANVLMEFEDNINKIYIKNLKNNHNISFHVNDNENVEWKFNVKYNNSINFSMCFKYDYKNILNNVVDELNLTNIKIGKLQDINNENNIKICKLQDINNENNIKIIKMKKKLDNINMNSFTDTYADKYYYLDKIPNNLHKPYNFHNTSTNLYNTSTNLYNTSTICHHRDSNIFDDFFG
jgi:hypothetical protein